MFWMKIDVCPKPFSAPPPSHVFDLQVKVDGPRSAIGRAPDS